jgi:NAD(P)-dependent dehydrogenase (short-subunit alcohol dehydrogenase family)
MNNQEMRHLRDQTVVITGASSGVGAAAARRLRQLGATVAVVGRSPERTAAVAAEIGAESHLVEFSRLDDVRRLAEELLARYPRSTFWPTMWGLCSIRARQPSTVAK